jgi:hypothetical protein
MTPFQVADISQFHKNQLYKLNQITVRLYINCQQPCVMVRNPVCNTYYRMFSKSGCV